MPLITSIQKYSIHDGDGIRTTVFFKGCPLSCVWCHNPETKRYEQEVLQDEERCSGCLSCVQVCPHHAIHSEQERAVTDREMCQKCGACLDYCPQNLREIAGQEYTVEDLIKQLKKDEMFYEESGGGVTLSGGEVMTMDMDYVEALVKKLHRMGITVTIDTCGHAPYERFARILPFVDTFLYDIKTLDSEVHKQYVGVDNELILNNLERLSRDGARIYIRIPVIKEVNGNKENLGDIISWLGEKNIHPAQVNLLPYHNTGAGKYGKLGQEYGGSNLHAPTSAEMNEFVTMFQEAGYQNTKIGG